MDEEREATYAPRRVIEACVLLSLVCRVQTRVGRYFCLGNRLGKGSPWSPGEVLWEGRVGDTLADPPPGDRTHLYGTVGEVISVALSRGVGSFLVMREVQDLFPQRLGPQKVAAGFLPLSWASQKPKEGGRIRS